MGNKTVSRGGGKSRAGTKRSDSRTQEKTWALTLKVDDGLYDRLRIFGATQRRTHQDMLRQALKEYLDRAGA